MYYFSSEQANSFGQSPFPQKSDFAIANYTTVKNIISCTVKMLGNGQLVVI